MLKVSDGSRSPSAADVLAGKGPSTPFRPDALPPDVEAKRAVASLRTATTLDEQRGAVVQLVALAPQVLALHDVALAAEAIAALDRLLPTVEDRGLLEQIDTAALALSDRGLVERMVQRLGEPRVPAEE